MARIVEHQMRFQVVMMTPVWAQELLEKNHPDNRKPKEKRILQYERDMRQGYWILTPEPICVDMDGWLTNGQNRLSAIIRADLDIPVTLITGCPKKSIQAQDQGATRTTVDTARVSGKPLVRGMNEVSLARAMYCGIRSDCGMSQMELLDFARQHNEAIRFAFECLPSNVKGITQSPVRAVIARAYYKRHLRNRTREFCEVLLSGLPNRPQEDSGAIRLRNWLLDTFLGGNKKSPKGARRWITFAKAERALHAFHKEESLVKLIEFSEEMFPLPGDDYETEPETNGRLAKVLV